MRRRIERGIVVLAAGALLLAVAPARNSLESVLDALEGVRSFKGTALSPDGARAAWVERVRSREGAETLSVVDVADLATGTTRRISAGADARAHREHSPAWSPDGRQIAFLSDAAKDRQLQLYVAPGSGGPARRLTGVAGQLGHPRWSPDGRTIAFLFVESSSQEPGALVAYRPDSGVVEEKIEEQRIATVDVASGKLRLVSPPYLYVYDYDWSPDGKSFAAEAAEGSGTNNYWIAQLYSIRIAGGEARSLWKPPLQIACPRFSPDGRSIAVIHGIMSDEGSTGGDVYLVPAEGGEGKNLTPGFQGSATALFWRPSGEIVFTSHLDGEDGVQSVDPATSKIATLWKDAVSVAGFSIARKGGAAAAIVSSFRKPPEVWAGSIGAWKPVTKENAGQTPFWGTANSLHWESGGATVQGWLLPPRTVEPGRRYPMVVSVHGGPSSVNGPGWPARWNAVIPSQDYFLFLPNPRGSYGHGEAFTRGNVKEFGYGDFDDILKGVDEAVRAGPIDPDRIGIAGWSYGGYMAMWAVTRTHRFKAAVAGAGIANWQSYYGQNRIDRWMIPFFGASVYEDPEVYARSSPITFIKKAKTPTLVLHGDRDSEVPTPQGYEFWHALKTLGVPTELVIYENEGHAVSKREHVRDIERRIVGWFDKYLKQAG
ncbi:MAG TPA: S9 family peptidase [Thermoanaerobaculia bacterium]|nr:S9 family peptidase [Thermoanaerobaculia bacterium]